MKIGFDLDCVLVDIMPSLLDFHNKKYGTKHKLKDQTKYFLGALWNCSREEATKRVHEWYHSSYFDDLPVVEGALEGINILSRKHSLHIVTSRPHFIQYKTDTWIDKNFKNKFTSIHHTNQVSKKGDPKRLKSKVCKDLKLEVFIEDHIEYAADIAESGIKVFLLTMRWNTSFKKLHKNITRVDSWKELVKEFDKM